MPPGIGYPRFMGGAAFGDGERRRALQQQFLQSFGVVALAKALQNDPYNGLGQAIGAGFDTVNQTQAGMAAQDREDELERRRRFEADRNFRLSEAAGERGERADNRAQQELDMRVEEMRNVRARRQKAEELLAAGLERGRAEIEPLLELYPDSEAVKSIAARANVALEMQNVEGMMKALEDFTEFYGNEEEAEADFRRRLEAADVSPGQVTVGGRPFRREGDGYAAVPLRDEDGQEFRPKPEKEKKLSWSQWKETDEGQGWFEYGENAYEPFRDDQGNQVLRKGAKKDQPREGALEAYERYRQGADQQDAHSALVAEISEMLSATTNDEEVLAALVAEGATLEYARQILEEAKLKGSSALERRRQLDATY